MRKAARGHGLVTWADNKKNRSVCLDAADVVAFNGYPSWYDSIPPGQYWADLAAWSKERYPEKPFIISETGAGGLYEWDNVSAVRWSQRLQAELVTANAEFAIEEAICRPQGQ